MFSKILTWLENTILSDGNKRQYTEDGKYWISGNGFGINTEHPEFLEDMSKTIAKFNKSLSKGRVMSKHEMANEQVSLGKVEFLKIKEFDTTYKSEYHKGKDMTNEEIKNLALENGFKLKEQADGSLDLNPYVYEFAVNLVFNELDKIIEDFEHHKPKTYEDAKWIISSAYGRVYMGSSKKENSCNVPLETHFNNFTQWSTDRKIIQNGNVLAQGLKLVSEVGELADNLAKGRCIKDDIGDCIVVLNNLVHMQGLTLDECLEQAWSDIKNRTGEMNRHGVFIKDGDV